MGIVGGGELKLTGDRTTFRHPTAKKFFRSQWGLVFPDFSIPAAVAGEVDRWIWEKSGGECVFETKGGKSNA